MARKMVILLPAILAAFTIGILGLLLVPSEVKNRDLSFPIGTINAYNGFIAIAEEEDEEV